MYYKQKKATLEKEGVWDEKSCVRRIGGYDIDKSTLPEGMKYLPKGAVVAFDNHKVKLVKTAKVYKEVSSGTELQVEKDHALKVGDIIGGKAISAINTTNSDYDALTVDTISAKITKGTVLADANETKALGLVYASVDLDDNPSCSVTVQAYEIQEDTLPYPVNDKIKQALTCRHAWKV